MLKHSRWTREYSRTTEAPGLDAAVIVTPSSQFFDPFLWAQTVRSQEGMVGDKHTRDVPEPVVPRVDGTQSRPYHVGRLPNPSGLCTNALPMYNATIVPPPDQPPSTQETPAQFAKRLGAPPHATPPPLHGRFPLLSLSMKAPQQVT